MSKLHLHTLVIGSGAAGLAAAVRLHALGITDLAVYTEGLRMGTSINTGSDKQTYYKLGMYGTEADSPCAMARDMASGGSIHGDIALVEAALSPAAFHHLVSLGVPFPHDLFGQHIGYKTDHDPKRRATSCGPYTSREMCLALTAELKRREITVKEKRVAAALLVTSSKRCCGAIFVNTKAKGPDALETVFADNVIFAVGGPGGLYAGSVYPAVHTGAIGIALEAGAVARNLPESQFGLASVKFRWNVSGSYMQVLPRFISRDSDGTEHEFLREYFATPSAMYDAIFLKGYQWPFAAGHVPGSSLVDLFVNREIVERKRRVFLDYRTDPADLDPEKLAPETKDYLFRSGAWADTPLKRLELLNAPAIALYRDHGIDLTAEPLEIAVCAQHNNGGLAADIWWQSENISRLFPVGEVNGSHGVTRPGGTALNAGQVGAFRAAEYIAGTTAELNMAEAEAAEAEALRSIGTISGGIAAPDWKRERDLFQKRMSRSGAFLRERSATEQALQEAQQQLEKLKLQPLPPHGKDLAEVLRNRQLLTAQTVYLSAILRQITDGVGSRGGAVVLDSTSGTAVHPALPHCRIIPEDPSFRTKTLLSERLPDGTAVHHWQDCRPVPEPDGWFENIWRDFRTGKLYT